MCLCAAAYSHALFIECLHVYGFGMHLESRQPDSVQAPSATSAAAAAAAADVFFFFHFVTLKQVQVSLTPSDRDQGSARITSYQSQFQQCSHQRYI